MSAQYECLQRGDSVMFRRVNRVAKPFKEFDDVLVTGTCHEWERVDGKLVLVLYQVTDLRAQVATIYPECHDDHDNFKIWPWDDYDPQLPKTHDGKLWFKRSTSTVKIINPEAKND